MELGILCKALPLKCIIISFPTLTCTSKRQQDFLSRPRLPSFLTKVASLHKNPNLRAWLHTQMYQASKKWGSYQFS